MLLHKIESCRQHFVAHLKILASDRKATTIADDDGGDGVWPNSPNMPRLHDHQQRRRCLLLLLLVNVTNDREIDVLSCGWRQLAATHVESSIRCWTCRYPIKQVTLYVGIVYSLHNI